MKYLFFERVAVKCVGLNLSNLERVQHEVAEVMNGFILDIESMELEHKQKSVNKLVTSIDFNLWSIKLSLLRISKSVSIQLDQVQVHYHDNLKQISKKE